MAQLSQSVADPTRAYTIMKFALTLVFLTLVAIQTSQCADIRFQRIFDFIKNNIRDVGKNLRQKMSIYLNLNAVEGNSPEKRLIKRYDHYRNTVANNPPRAQLGSSNNNDAKTCEDDPSIHFTTPELILSHGYPVETHTILTDDGYFLNIHRIPNRKETKRGRHKTVLLHHGLLGSSADWVITGPKKALSYILWEAGYDVWLANARGNTYSRSHAFLPTNSFAFWNFTFHEISQHDLPAVIDYIMDLKGWDSKINYIGHSMGTTVLFALLSTKPHYNKVLRSGFALAPVAYMSDIKSPIKLLARFSNDIEFLMKILGANEFLPNNEVVKFLSKYACEVNHYEEAICENSMFYLCGFDAKQFNRSLIPAILGHVPAGASTKTLIHYSQEIYNNGHFQQFDYGREENVKRYGTTTPPQYNLTKVTLPIALLSAENDWLASETAVANLFSRLANPIEHYIVPLKEFNHIDFLWAIDAPSLVYKRLLHLMEKGTSHHSHHSANDIHLITDIL